MRSLSYWVGVGLVTLGFISTVASLRVEVEGHASTSDCQPQPKIHATKTGADTFNVEASCPVGWLSHIDPKVAKTYNDSDKSYADMINMMAEATCVADKGKQ
jgi:hypothetical protein